MKLLPIFITLVILGLIIQPAISATLTWTGRAGNGLFDDPKNYDFGTAPTLADHIDIPSGNVVLSKPTSIGSLRVASGATLRIESTLTYSIGVTIEEGASVTVFHGGIVTNTPPIISTPGLTVAPSVTYPTISVVGKLTVSESIISGSTPNSSGNVEPTSVLNILNGGVLHLRSRRDMDDPLNNGSFNTDDELTSTILKNMRVVVSSQGQFVYGPSENAISTQSHRISASAIPLLFTFCIMNIHPGGRTIIQDGSIDIDSTVVSSSSSGAAIASRPNKVLVQGGELIFDVSMLQQLARNAGTTSSSTTRYNIKFKPEVDVFESGRVLFTNLRHDGATASTDTENVDNLVLIQLLGVIDVEEAGIVEITNDTHVSFASPQHTLYPRSQLHIRPGSILYCDAGQSIFRGMVNSAAAPQGSIVVKSTTHFAGEIYIMDLEIHHNLAIGTSTVSTPHTPVVEVHGNLAWSNGTIEARGIIRGASTAGGNTAANQSIRVLKLAQSGKLVLDASRSSNNRILKQVQFHIHSPFAVMSEKQGVVLQQDAGLYVFSGGILGLHPGSQLIGDDSEVILHVANGATLAVLTDIQPILVDIDVIIDGLLIAGGKESNTMGEHNIIRFRKDFIVNNQIGAEDVENSCAHIIIEENNVPSTTASGSLRTFEPQTNTVLKLPQQIVGKKIDISLYNKSISLSRQHQWQFRHLALINSHFHVPQLHLFGMLIIGDDNSPGRFLSDSTITVGGINLQHGIVEGPGAIVSAFGLHFLLNRPKEYAIVSTVVGPNSMSKCHTDASVGFVTGSIIKFEQDAVFEIAPGCELVDNFNDKSFLALSSPESASTMPSATALTNSLNKYQQTLPQLWFANSRMVFISSGTSSASNDNGEKSSSKLTPAIIDLFVRNSGSVIESQDKTQARLTHSMLCEDDENGDATSNNSKIILASGAHFDIANYPLNTLAITNWNRQNGGSQNNADTVEAMLQKLPPQLTTHICRIDNGDDSTLTLQHGTFALKPLNVGRVMLANVVSADFAHGCYEKHQQVEAPMLETPIDPSDNAGSEGPEPIVNPCPCTDDGLGQPVYPPGLIHDEGKSQCKFLGADSTMMGWLFFALAILFLITTIIFFALMTHFRRENNETQKKITTIQRHHRRQQQQQEQQQSTLDADDTTRASEAPPPRSSSGNTRHMARRASGSS